MSGGRAIAQELKRVETRVIRICIVMCEDGLLQSQAITRRAADNEAIIGNGVHILNMALCIRDFVNCRGFRSFCWSTGTTVREPFFYGWLVRLTLVSLGLGSGT